MDKFISTMEDLQKLNEEINFKNILDEQLISFAPKGVRLIGKVDISQNASSYTNGKLVCLGLSKFYLNQPASHVLANFYAVGYHELFHVYFSDFELYSKLQKKIIAEFESLILKKEPSFNRNQAKNLARMLAVFIGNGTEDGRIEFLGTYVIPGSKIYISNSNLKYWEDSKRKWKKNEKTCRFTAMLEAILSISVLRILPYNFNKDWAKNDPIHLAIESITQDIFVASRSNTAIKHYEACLRIFDKIKGFMVDQAILVDVQSLENFQDLEEDFEGTKERVFVSETELENASSEQQEQGQRQEEQEEEQERQNGEQKQDKLINHEDLNKIKEEFQKEEIKLSKELRNALEKEKSEQKQFTSTSNVSEDTLKIALSDYRKFFDQKVRFNEYYPTKKDYTLNNLPANTRIQGEKLKREISKILKKRIDFVSRNKKRGSLDSSRLWSVAVDSDKVFYRKKDNNKRMSVGYILIDGSGSMVGKPLDTAIEMAATLEIGLKDLIPIKISKFTANKNSISHHVVKDFDQKIKNVNSSWSLQDMIKSDCYGNADGISIRYAIEDLLMRSENERILTIISDGLPSYYQNTKQALEHVRKEVEYGKKMGIKIISIYIGKVTEEVKKSFEYMYQDSVLFTDLDNLVKSVTQIYKKLLL